jgi:probable rRNA maturation factor
MTPPPGRRAGAPEIDIQVASPLWATQPLAEQTVRAAIAAARTARDAHNADGEVSVLLADDAAVRALNRDWRAIDKPTNVLSFPAAKETGGKLLGDIALAYDTLVRECADEQRDFLHHLAHLTVHGFLHLIGYDHETEQQASEMEGLESRIMRSMNMPDPYLARDLERS